MVYPHKDAIMKFLRIHLYYLLLRIYCSNPTIPLKSLKTISFEKPLNDERQSVMGLAGKIDDARYVLLSCDIEKGKYK